MRARARCTRLVAAHIMAALLGAGCGDDGPVSPICTPAEVRCVVGGPPGLEVCSDSGAEWEEGASCAVGEFCEDGTCQAGGCVPQCDGLSCGDDLCGGSCGECPVGEGCEEGQCVPLVLPDPVGDDCTAPIILVGEYPLEGTGDTASIVRSDRYNTGETCGRIGAGAPEQVWVFEAQFTGGQDIRVEPDGDYDPAVYIWDTCGQAEAACGDVHDAGGPGVAEEFSAFITKGELVYVVVDGSGTSSGRYTLHLLGTPEDCEIDCFERECGQDGCGGSCGDCPGGTACTEAGVCELTGGKLGDSCFDPHVLAAADLPETDQASTAAPGTSNAHTASACGDTGADGPDEVWRVEVPARAQLDVTLVPTIELDAAVWFGTSCDDLGASCLASFDEAGPGTTELASITAEQGDVFVVVDGVDGTSGGYDIELALRPLGGGDLCSEAAELTVPDGVFATTAGFVDDIWCDAVGAGLPDQFWRLAEVPADPVTVIVEPASAFFNPVIHLLEGCDGACMETYDLAGPGETEEALIPAGSDWVIVVDGTTGGGGVGLGDYTIRLE